MEFSGRGNITSKNRQGWLATTTLDWIWQLLERKDNASFPLFNRRGYGHFISRIEVKNS